MLPTTISPLGRQISSLLTTKTLGHPLYYYNQVTTTNSIALEAAEAGAGHGSVYASDYQTHGRGRQGKVWTSERGLNLTFSVILDFQVGSDIKRLIPIASCLGVASAIGEYVTPSIPLFKWPNDILINGHKVSGMLLQALSPPLNQIILGIGINVNQTQFPNEFEQQATSLILCTGQQIDRASLMASVLAHLENTLELLQQSPSTICQLYSDKLIWIGQRCRVSGTNQLREGLFLGIDQSGALLLKTDTGTQTIYAGDVSIRMADD